MRNVLVVGSLNMDMTIYVDRIPARGETVSGNGFLLSPGGKGANQAVAASRMGAKVSMLGCVGEDVFGRTLVETLQDAGVDTALIDHLPDETTGVASITVCDGDNRISLYGGANPRVTRAQIDRARGQFIACDAVIVQLEIPLDTVLYTIETAHALGKEVYLNPAPAQELPVEIYAHVDYLLPNEGEAGWILSKELITDADMFAALGLFREMGVKHPIITLGDRGVACYIEDRPRIIPGNTVRAVDTTAAGDTLIGALAANLSPACTMLDAINLAQRAAAICVTRQGAQKTIPTLEELSAWQPVL